MKITFLLWHGLFLLFFFFFFFNNGCVIQALTYDYSATTECLEEAWEVQYGGGIIQNPEFDNGVENWTVFGRGKIQERITKCGNKFIAATNRTHPSDGLSQRIQLENGKLYAFSAWIQISKGSEIIAVKFRCPSGVFLHGGTVIAEQGCWCMLKGGIVANFSGPVDLTFETNNTSVEVWVDNVSLQPFTKKQWRLHQETTIAKVRKRRVKFQVINKMNAAVGGANIILKQTKSGFPIGCEINLNVLNSTKYRDWFASRFSVTAFGNEMKWYFTEKKAQGRENYTVPDAMLKFCEQNNIDVRGHNIFWDDPKYQPPWLNAKINPQKLKKLVEKRLKSVVLRYKGRLIHWDVMNENLHFRFYEDKLGENASAEIYAKTYELDPKPILFMNEYSTIEVSEDEESMPAKYARKLKNIVSYYRGRNRGKILPMGIGLESRFEPGQPNLAYMRAGMDYLASMGFPIWLTEVFVDKGENQAEYLEEVLREGHSHPAVKGIVIWPTSPFSKECKMCLIDVNQNFKITPTGEVIDKLIAEWRSKLLNISTNGQGFSEAELHLGNYEVTIRHPETNSSTELKLKVTENDSANIVQVST